MLNNFNDFKDLNMISILIVILAGVWGAAISFLKRENQHESIYKKIVFFFVDMFINIGLTLLTYIGLIGYGVNELLAVAISGFAGHLGTRSFYIGELIIAEKLGAKQTFAEIVKNRKEK